MLPKGVSVSCADSGNFQIEEDGSIIGAVIAVVVLKCPSNLFYGHYSRQWSGCLNYLLPLFSETLWNFLVNLFGSF